MSNSNLPTPGFHLPVASESGLFNPRILVAFALCSCGVLLGMSSLVATPPVETPRPNIDVPSAPVNFPSTSGNNANTLPPGVPLPPGAQFSVNEQDDPSSGSPITGFPGLVGRPLRPWTASGAYSHGNPGVAPHPPSLSVPEPATSASMPLAPAASDWAIVNSPNSVGTRTPNALAGVACASASDCWAVGRYHNGSAYQTLIERWDGTSWTIVNSPNTNPAQDNFLYGVTCVSVSDCWAVGYAHNGSAYQTLIERWDGTSWAIVASPSINATQNNILSGVTCASASDCWTVGFHFNGTVYQTLIERWDGSSWAVVSSPNTNTTQTNILYGVTCASASTCWAVGYARVGGNDQTLVERWDGNSWAIVNSPNTSPTQSNLLNSVTCVGASDCWAVGFSSGGGGPYQTLIERWDGNSWAIVTSPSFPLQYNFLYGVTCASATDCWAVGYTLSTTVAESIPYETLIEHWNGTSWTIASSANTSPLQSNFISSVTCLSASNCWTVGFYLNGTAYQTLSERWDGISWAIVTSPSSSPMKSTNLLLDATCVSASDCWAVGRYDSGINDQTLIERWNGTAWTIVNSPNTSPTQANALSGVTCVSASDCWAVGSYFDGITYQTLIERWDGTSWTIIASPTPLAAVDSFLFDLTCVSASECWATGYYYSGAAYQTLVERWDGSSWTIVASPNTNTTQNNFLSGVTCVSGSECWTVGRYHNGTAYQTLVERWDGTSWSIISSPNTNTAKANLLSGVTCTSGSECWAVGYARGSSSDQTLIERWDGSSWAIVTSPNTATTQANSLSGVTCASASDCWAVGGFVAGTTYQTLIERWNGISWAIVSSPNTSMTQNNFLSGITCGSTSGCRAVGYFKACDSCAIQTLIEHYAPSQPPTPVSAASRKIHGIAGMFDVNLPLMGNPGIECRTGGASGDYQVVITFPSAVIFTSAAVTSGAGAVSSTSGSGTTAITVNLGGITNAQTTTLTLSGVNDGTSSGDVGVPMSVLLGDTTANANVSNTDVSAVKAEVSSPVTASNFRTDVNANGIISNTDVSTTKAQVSTSLPP